MRPASNPPLTRPCRTHDSRDLCIHRLATCIALFFVMLLPGMHVTGAAAQPVEPSWAPLVDRAALLDEGQHSSAAGDVARLNQSGIPAQIVIEPTGYGPDEAAARADELRVDNGVESRPGADDGLVIYASVSPTNPENVVIAVSTGNRALPAGGLTTGDLDTIRETIIDPQLSEGQPARAIVYAMREMLYQQVFTPPPMQPLDASRQDRRDAFQIAALFVTAATCAAMVLSAKRPGGLIAPAIGLVVAVATFALGVAFQSGLAIACSLALLVLVIALAIRRDDRAKDRREVRRLTATPRPPGSFRPAAR